MHLGNTPGCSHYWSLLIEPTGKMWWTDDNTRAQAVARGDIPTVLRNAYIIFLHPDGGL